MALVLGTDTYLTAPAAVDYFEAYGPGNVQLTEADLRKATLALDRLYYGRFLGSKTSAAQPLEFPRGGETTIPTAVAHATAELALLLQDGFDPYAAPPATIVETSFEVDGISRKTKYATSDAVNRLYKLDVILAPYLTLAESLGGITWVDVVPA
jgi:hypothetical protein